MSDPYDFDESGENTAGGLRKLYEDALKAKKTAEQEAAAAKRDLAVHVTQGVLKEKGFKESAASWAAKDGVDLSDEAALTKWLEGPGQDFKLPESDPQEVPNTTEGDGTQVQQPANTQTNGQPVFGSSHVQAHNDVMAQLRAEASPATVSKFEQVANSLPADATAAQVDAAYRAAGL